ncbi:MAG: class I SAM-dependent methyltransferase [Elusimicrobiales bacterium]
MKTAESVSCPVCSLRETDFHSSGYDYLAASGREFSLVRCLGCGLVYLPSGPEPEAAGALYQAAYYRKMRGLSKFLETLFLRERRRAVERFKKAPGTLLDLGCGTGEFAAAMRDAGWDAAGVEPSPAAKENAAGADKIYRRDLPDLKFPAGSFDAVTLWQVLEHLPDPARYLAEIRRLLKADGLLLVSVPNINSLQAVFSGDKWFHLDLPRHRWQFTPETVSRLLVRAGFRIREIRHFSLEYNPFGWWQSLFNLLGCEINFAYKRLKRGSVRKDSPAAKRFYTVLCTALFALPLLPAAFILSFLESALRRGGVITVSAEMDGDGNER